MTTRRFAVVGDPVAASASPRMHNAAFDESGLDCSYEAIQASAAELPHVIGRLRVGELAGLSVTIPHKQRVLSYVDVVNASARAAGAANTLVRATDGRLVAHNTDVPAMAAELAALASAGFAWKSARALVLGTGATARSAIVALGQLGVADVTVRGRSFADQASRAAFRDELSARLFAAAMTPQVTLEPWGAVVATDESVMAIVQATSLGMEGSGAGALAADSVEWSVVAPNAVALDVVYGALRGPMTPFVSAATSRGLRAVDGRGMLARQGALAFELWFQRPAPIDTMRAALGVAA